MKSLPIHLGWRTNEHPLWNVNIIYLLISYTHIHIFDEKTRTDAKFLVKRVMINIDTSHNKSWANKLVISKKISYTNLRQNKIFQKLILFYQNKNQITCC